MEHEHFDLKHFAKLYAQPFSNKESPRPREAIFPTCHGHKTLESQQPFAALMVDCLGCPGCHGYPGCHLGCLGDIRWSAAASPVTHHGTSAAMGTAAAVVAVAVCCVVSTVTTPAMSAISAISAVSAIPAVSARPVPDKLSAGHRSMIHESKSSRCQKESWTLKLLHLHTELDFDTRLLSALVGQGQDTQPPTLQENHNM